MRVGIDTKLEDEADRLLRQSLEGVHSHIAKSDLLTPWKEHDRKRREVRPGVPDKDSRDYLGVSGGAPEVHFRLGMYNRGRNLSRPDLNSRDGLASFNRVRKGRPAWDAGDTLVQIGQVDPNGRVLYETITLQEYQEALDG